MHILSLWTTFVWAIKFTHCAIDARPAHPWLGPHVSFARADALLTALGRLLVAHARSNALRNDILNYHVVCELQRGMRAGVSMPGITTKLTACS